MNKLRLRKHCSDDQLANFGSDRLNALINQKFAVKNKIKT